MTLKEPDGALATYALTAGYVVRESKLEEGKSICRPDRHRTMANQENSPNRLVEESNNKWPLDWALIPFEVIVGDIQSVTGA